jgi:hypothetical protein
VKRGLESKGIVTGSTVFTFTKGETVIKGIIFNQSPGVKGVKFSLQTDAINIDVIQKILSPSYKI